MTWRGWLAQFSHADLRRTIAQLELERDSARDEAATLFAEVEALTEARVKLAHAAEVAEMLCEQAMRWLITLPISSADQFYEVREWLDSVQRMIRGEAP